MDKEIITLAIAKNGLDTAQLLLEAKVVQNENRAASADITPKEKKALLSGIKKTRKLIAALKASEAGLVEYIAEASKI